MKCLRQESRSQVKVMGKENDLKRCDRTAETHLKRRCIQHRIILRKEPKTCNERALDSNKTYSEETWHQDYLV